MLYITHDGAFTWEILDFPPVFYNPEYLNPDMEGGIRTIEFGDLNSCLMLLNSGEDLRTLWHTVDGGISWSLFSPVLIGAAGGDEYYAFSTGLQNSLIEAGIAAVDFAPQGRGESEGDDNFHGTVHQDDLKVIADFLPQLPLVQEDNIGILSWSYGVILATGALARYPDMAVSFLIDWEGPSCPGKDFQRGLENNEAWVYEIIRYLNNGQDMTEEQLRFLVLHGGSIYDDEYWYERDASRFAADLPCPYLRVQFEHDHAQGIYKYHMMSIVNAAAGSGQWTRVNNNPPNTIYSDDNLSEYFFHEYNENKLPQTMSMDSAYVDSVLMGYIEEMFFSKPYNNPSSAIRTNRTIHTRQGWKIQA